MPTLIRAQLSGQRASPIQMESEIRPRDETQRAVIIQHDLSLVWLRALWLFTTREIQVSDEQRKKTTTQTSSFAEHMVVNADKGTSV